MYLPYPANQDRIKKDSHVFTFNIDLLKGEKDGTNC